MSRREIIEPPADGPISRHIGVSQAHRREDSGSFAEATGKVEEVVEETGDAAPLAKLGA
jgi:hypothetical protein